MKEHVTVIPRDKTIICDGHTVTCDIVPHVEHLHALQWHQGSGHIERKINGVMCNQAITSYETEVKPYVDLWQSEQEQQNAPLTFDEVETARLDELNQAFGTALKGLRFTSSVGFDVNADETANRNISNLIVAMEATGRKTVRFCAYDNTFHDVTLAQLKIMQLEVIDRTQALYEAKWALREKIRTAQTIDALKDIPIGFRE